MINMSEYINRYVIIRTYSAGVHYGFLRQSEGTVVELRQARRIWQFQGRFTLSEVANQGLEVTEDGYTRLSEAVEMIVLTEAVEILPIADEARSLLQDAPAWVPPKEDKK